MIFEEVDELDLVCVLHRGEPNQECIALKARRDMPLGAYGVMLALVGHSGSAKPIRDALYWFGNGQIKTGDWILLYTGGGEPRVSDNNEGTKTYAVFWGRSKTVFANGSVVPVLFRMDALTVGEVEEEKDQVGERELLPAPQSSQLRLGG